MLPPIVDGRPVMNVVLHTRRRRLVTARNISGPAVGKPAASTAWRQSSYARCRIRAEPSANVARALVTAAPRKLAGARACSSSSGSSSGNDRRTSDALEDGARPETTATAHRHEGVV